MVFLFHDVHCKFSICFFICIIFHPHTVNYLFTQTYSPVITFPPLKNCPHLPLNVSALTSLTFHKQSSSSFTILYQWDPQSQKFPELAGFIPVSKRDLTFFWTKRYHIHCPVYPSQIFWLDNSCLITSQKVKKIRRNGIFKLFFSFPFFFF